MYGYVYKHIRTLNGLGYYVFEGGRLVRRRAHIADQRAYVDLKSDVKILGRGIEAARLTGYVRTVHGVNPSSYGYAALRLNNTTVATTRVTGPTRLGYIGLSKKLPSACFRFGPLRTC